MTALTECAKRLIEERKPQRPDDDPDDHSLFLGVCSNYLCDINPGDEVLVTGPSGKRFLLPANPEEHDFLFIAAGTGRRRTLISNADAIMSATSVMA